MIYVEITYQVVPRYKTKEALQSFAEDLYSRDKEHIESVGGKVIGMWTTDIGKAGEVTMLVAYPSLDARVKMAEVAAKDTEFQKAVASSKWMALTHYSSVKVLRPTAFSPLQ